MNIKVECPDYWNRMARELLETGNDLVSFYKEKKKLRWYCAFVILVTWVIKIVYEDIFIDSEIMMLEPYALLHSWYGSKRFGLIVTKKLFNMIRLVPVVSNLLFVIVLWNVVLLLCFCMEQWLAEDSLKPYAMYLFAAVFVTTPTLAEQYVFTLQSFEITMAMVYCIVAAFCAGEAVYHKKTIIWHLISLAFMIWGFASYQAFVPFYIALVLISFICSYQKSQGIYGLKHAMQQILLFLAGFILYILMAEFLCRWKGGDSSYVNAMFAWGKQDVQECLRSIREDFMVIYGGWVPVLFHKYFGICAFLAAAILIYNERKTRSWNYVWYSAAVVMLMLAPMYVTVITGIRTPIRSQLVFPLVWAFAAAALWIGIGRILLERKWCLGIKKVICGLLLVLGLHQAWYQGMNLVQLSQTLHEAVEHDRMMANRLYADICHVADRPDMQNCKVAFVGTRDARLATSVTRGEVIGHSYFDFGITDIGVTNRVNALFNLLGMNMCPPTAEEYGRAVAACEGRDIWPASEAIFYVDDVLVVKLSD